ncbi:MAG: protein kinase [Planctomycetes bacterium]|nr:protein kinase [Planctomycetota bacterium]
MTNVSGPSSPVPSGPSEQTLPAPPTPPAAAGSASPADPGSASPTLVAEPSALDAPRAPEPQRPPLRPPLRPPPPPPPPQPTPSDPTAQTIREAPPGATEIRGALAGGPALAPSPSPDATVRAPLPRSLGNYELLSEVARGGMGVVYRARQPGLDRVVALKVMLDGEFASAETLERFLREARAAARLQHPSIVPIHEVGSVEGRHFFTMDFVEGLPLHEYVADRAPSPRAILELVRQVSEAVAYAHAQGVIHRDLKPQNILVDASARPHLLDFGLAKDLHDAASRTRSGYAFGTPAYMPPEQAAGDVRAIDERSDVYSLGAILFEAFTGRAPFEGDNPASILHAVVNEEPPLPSALAPDLHREIELIIRKAMAKEKASRYAGAGALADDIGRFLDGRPILARPPSWGCVVARFARRNRRAVSAGAAVAGTALAVVVLLALAVQRGRAADRLLAEAASVLHEALDAPLERFSAGDLRTQLEAALQGLDRVLEKDPRRATACCERAIAREALRDLAGAAEDFGRARSLDPGLREAAYHEARLLAALGKAEAARERLAALAAAEGPFARLARAERELLEHCPMRAVPEARTVLSGAASASPDDVRARACAERLLARVYGDRRWSLFFDQPRALGELDQAISAHPSEPGLYQARARVRIHLRRAREGLEDCRRALARGETAELLAVEGEALLQLRGFEEALALGRRLATLPGGAELGRILQARALTRLGRPAPAQAIFDRLAEAGTAPTLFAALEILRAAPAEYADRVEGLKQRARALDPSFDDFEGAVELGEVLLAPEFRLAQVKDPFTEALRKRFPDHPLTHYVLGLRAAYASKVPEALSELDLAIQGAPEAAGFYMVRGVVRVATVVRIPDAVEDLNRMLLLDPSNTDALRLRAYTHLFAGRRAAAVQDLAERALLLDYTDLEKEAGRMLTLPAEPTERFLLNFLSPMFPGVVEEVAERLCVVGEAGLETDPVQARRALARASLLVPRRTRPLVGLARLYVRAGDEGAALEFLERAERGGCRDAAALEASPDFGLLSGSPRFQKLVERMKAATKDREGAGPGGR